MEFTAEFWGTIKESIQERKEGEGEGEEKERSEEKTNLFNPHDIGLNAPMEVKCKDVVKTKLSPDDSETKTMQ